MVQTFIHDAYTDGNGNTTISLGNPRDTIGYFPDNPNLTFEKIIMCYNMRCKDNVVNTSGGTTRYGCGAYDYSCQTYIHDSTRVDSILNFTPDHIISNFSGNIYNYSSTPVYNYYHYLFNYFQYNTVIDSVINEDTISIGGGSIDSNIVVNSNELAGKSQFLYLADELNLFSLNDTIINGLSIYVNSSNAQTVNFLKIKLKLTNDTILNPSNPHINGFTEVYHSNTILNYGTNRLQFYNPFAWDSASNIIIEFSFTDSLNTSNTLIVGDTVSDNIGLHSNDASYIQVIGNENIDIASSSLSAITDEITISFWANGDENILPVNTSLFEALDSNGARTVNLHFPWSNGRVYWDCGNNSTTYDRIDKAANTNEYTGSWSHWTFTKNTNTGSMKIYRNGILWHSGTANTLPINIHSFKLMSNGDNSNFWSGKLKEFRIFNKELSISTIQNWMHQRLDSNHPDYSNLIAYYPFNEGAGNYANDYSSYLLQANFNGNVKWHTNGEEIPTFFNPTSFRPKISFFQGAYIDTIINDTIIISSIDSSIAIPNTITLRHIVPNYGTVINDSIGVLYLDSILGWESISYIYTYDENGLNTVTMPANIDSTINISELTYYTRYPMAFQIMSFVTPFGGWLDFGENGKTWHFDVTDFSPILKGEKRITMSGGGQWQEDVDIKFLFIVGTPPRDVLNMQQIWRPQSKGYSTIMADRSFEPRNYRLLSNAQSYKLRTVITGHGQQGEFIPQTHYINVDGGAINDSWQVWTQCADNPIYPQGGTWTYDRAGWCPGQASDLRELDITSVVTPGQSHSFDYGVNSASGSSNYWVSSQLVSYGDINHTLDASVSEILSPTNHPTQIRKNPMCSKPKIIIQNTGSTILTSLKIEYWCNNSTIKEVYQWNGNLNFLEKEEVILPVSSTLWDNISYSGAEVQGDVTFFENNSEFNNFHVEISNPNGAIDGYSFNNKISSSFTPPPIYPNIFTFWYTTNSGSDYAIPNPVPGGFPLYIPVSQTSWKIKDVHGNALYRGDSLYTNTPYKDTIALNDGCYSLEVIDSGENGLDYWHQPDQGSGMMRFRRTETYIDTITTPPSYYTWIKTFEMDFGKSIHHEFITSSTALNISEETTESILIYPNPTSDNIIIQANLKGAKKIMLQDYLGRTIYSNKVLNDKFIEQINLSKYSNGMYLLKIISDDKEHIRKVIKN